MFAGAASPTSIVSRVLKAKYFPSCDFMDAHLRANPSYTWNNIIAGREILREGLVWRVGDGEEVNIGKQKWIPEVQGFQLWDQQIVLANLQLVFQLINTDKRSWNEDLINENFSNNDTQAIMRIPLSQSHQSDKRFWASDSHREFTVKSAYKVAWNNVLIGNLLNHAPGYDALAFFEQRAQFWKRLWRLNIQPKAKVFAWRLCRKALATKDRLRSRGVETQDGYYICRGGVLIASTCILWMPSDKRRDPWCQLGGSKWNYLMARSNHQLSDSHHRKAFRINYC